MALSVRRDRGNRGRGRRLLPTHRPDWYLGHGLDDLRVDIEHENLLEHPEKWLYEAPAWVFSTRELPAVKGTDIHFVQGDVAPVHTDMVKAAAGKNVWLVGGGDLVGQFHDQGLLDEIILSVAPVTLASGAPLLPRRITNPPLKLANVEKQGDVFAVLIYEVQQSTEN